MTIIYTCTTNTKAQIDKHRPQMYIDAIRPKILDFASTTALYIVPIAANSAHLLAYKAKKIKLLSI